MGNKYICARCGRQMKLDNETNTLTCKGIFCRHEISLAEYLLSPDINILLGKTKTNGEVLFLINSKDKKFAIEVDKVDNLNSEICNFGPFDINQLLNVQIVTDNNILYENKNGHIPMLAGGILFGSVGAIAGSMITNQKQNIKNKVSYHLILKINDIRIPSFYIETEDSDLVYKFINTIELLRPQNQYKK
ncbi:MAG TPA: hypothetical protein DD621_00110 [Clostridiales bacterium]|nr:hypothetical protein [Clostridiales bacterium]